MAMFGPPTSEIAAGVWAVAAGGALVLFGFLLVDAVLPARTWDLPARLGLALAGVCAYSLVLMVVHMGTRGALFSNPSLVRGPTAVLIAGLLIRKLLRRDGNGAQWWLWLGAALFVAVAVWGTPIFRMLPLTSTADTQLHNGWIRQLMNGETTPGAVITGDIPNYYPWLFHALGSLATYVTPGRNPYYALGTLQVLITCGALLTWFALGHSLVRRWIGGAAGALFGALAGGFGFAVARTADVIVNPRIDGGAEALRYGGDLLFTRSYNLAFHNLVPPFPRDLAFALMAAFVMLLVVAVRRKSVGRFALAGTSLGLVGLAGGETFIASSIAAACVSLIPWGISRLRVAVAIFAPALAVYALWAIPVAVNYARLGGFVTITHIAPVDLPFYAVIVVWGMALPFGVFGTAIVIRELRTDPVARLLATVTVALIVSLALAAAIPSLLGDAFETLGRRHRYWPLLYLGVASLAVVGATRAASLLRARIAVAGASLVVVAATIASPALATSAVPDRLTSDPVLEEAVRRAPGSVLNAIDRSPGRRCTVAAPQDIAREVFSYTGYRLVLWTGSWFGANRARIRWADIYDRIAPDAERIRDNRILVNGWGEPQAWQEIAEKYNVDMVIAPSSNARYRPFRGLPRRAAGDYVVLTVDRCGD